MQRTDVFRVSLHVPSNKVIDPSYSDLPSSVLVFTVIAYDVLKGQLEASIPNVTLRKLFSNSDITFSCKGTSVSFTPETEAAQRDDAVCKSLHLSLEVAKSDV